jgi:lipid II:glycine glycyltransferase (peptidoglycan interpeptide bridge formation enzyme)
MPPPSSSAWDDFVRQHPSGHFLQLSAWAALKTAHGWNAVLSTQTSDAGIASGAQILLRHLPAGIGAIAYAPRGPVVDWEDKALARAALDGAAATAKSAGAFALVFEPELLDGGLDLRGDNLIPLDFSVQPPRTIWVDLAGDEAAVLARMKQKTRYNVGLARRKGVTVRPGGAADSAAFGGLMRATAERDGFSIHPAAYYADALRLLGDDAALLLAESEGETLAALLVVACGQRATYLYGASSNTRRELMAPYPLQWEAMRWAKARGCATYDLWGVPDEDEAALEAGFEARHDGLWGVYRHKRGYGGQLVRHVGAWARVISPLRWRAYEAARRLRKTHGLAA